MLNESKVKLMTRMAMYESKQGEEDFKISSYYKKDYRSFHTIATIIWVTVGYAVSCDACGSCDNWISGTCYFLWNRCFPFLRNQT